MNLEKKFDIFCWGLAALLLLVILFVPTSAYSEEVDDTAELTPEKKIAKQYEQRLQTTSDGKSTIGALVPDANPLNSSGSKNAIYFLAVLAVGFSLYKKFAKNSIGKENPFAITILSRCNLSQKSCLLVAEVEGKKFFLSQGVDGARLISRLDKEESFEEAISKVSFMEDSVEQSPITANG